MGVMEFIVIDKASDDIECDGVLGQAVKHISGQNLICNSEGVRTIREHNWSIQSRAASACLGRLFAPPSVSHVAR
jgi:hypothetical protein